MKTINYIFLFTGVLTLWSCEEFFSTTIDLDPPEFTPQLAATAMFNTTDTFIYVYVDEATDIFSGDRFGSSGSRGVEGATVELLREGGGVSTFGGGANGRYTGAILGLNNSEELTLRVAHPDFKTITAIQKVPTKVIPSNYRYVENAGTDEYGYATSGVEVTFQDPPGESNFYEVAIFFKDSLLSNPSTEMYEYYFNTTYNSTLDPNATQGPNYTDLFINDAGFDGENYKLLVQYENYYDTSNSLVVVFTSISEARYRFATSIRAFKDSGSFGPFGEPVSIYSNFENGLGAFGVGIPHIEEL